MITTRATIPKDSWDSTWHLSTSAISFQSDYYIEWSPAHQSWPRMHRKDLGKSNPIERVSHLQRNGARKFGYHFGAHLGQKR
jgi:hypothetical protein